MRIELEYRRKGLPVKFHVIYSHKGQVYYSNGLVDPKGRRMLMNKGIKLEVAPEVRVAALKKVGYEEVIKTVRRTTPKGK